MNAATKELVDDLRSVGFAKHSAKARVDLREALYDSHYALRDAIYELDSQIGMSLMNHGSSTGDDVRERNEALKTVQKSYKSFMDAVHAATGIL